jgi:gas vesicle protein
MSTKTGWYLLGVGLVTGAAAALLYAPQAGSQSRRDLRKKGARILDEVEANSTRAYNKTRSMMRGAQKFGKNCLSGVAAPADMLRRVASR